MARTQRRLSTLALGLALGAAYCSGGDGGKGPRADDPRGVTERVRTLVARFTYDASGPYTASTGGGVFAPSQGGPFEGADSPGVIGPPSLNGGVYDRTDFCSSACQQVATCFGASVPASCAFDCNAQVQEVGRRLGNGCLGPLVDFYSCIFDSLICRGAPVDDGEGDNDDDDEGPLVVAPDAFDRCEPAVQGLLSCANRSDLDDVFEGDDDDDDDGQAGSSNNAAGGAIGGNAGGGEGGNGGGG